MYRLTKMSSSGFQMQSESLDQILSTLEKHVCTGCIVSETSDDFSDLRKPEDILNELLWTTCGAEFVFEDSVEDPLMRHWHCEESLDGYTVFLRVDAQVVSSGIDREHWENHLIPVELLRITIGRLQRQMNDVIFPLFRGRFWCDWDYN